MRKPLVLTFHHDLFVRLEDIVEKKRTGPRETEADSGHTHSSAGKSRFKAQSTTQLIVFGDDHMFFVLTLIVGMGTKIKDKTGGADTDWAHILTLSATGHCIRALRDSRSHKWSI